MSVLITGVAGQDGTLLATQLSQQGFDVVGLIKPGTPHRRLKQYVPDIKVVEVDMMNVEALRDCVRDVQPTQIYNLGAFSAPGESWDREAEVRQVNVEAVVAMLDVARLLRHKPRFFQASSSHIFEGTDRSPQDETFDLSPRSPYAKSKAEALSLVRDARERHGLFAVSAIMYNHESPLRTDHFVTRKVSKAVARISRGLQDSLELGDVEVARDWGWAPDYVAAMRLMMQAEQPSDFVLATGISHRLSFFVQKAFAAAGIDDWRSYVLAAPSDRPIDTNKMVGNSARAYRVLGWRHTVDFDQMASRMVDFDLRRIDDPQAVWWDFGSKRIP